jgi:hypothetical protein
VRIKSGEESSTKTAQSAILMEKMADYQEISSRLHLEPQELHE